MPRGISQHLIDHPVFETCWCGRTFQKKADNQFHCSANHRRLASILRKHNPPVPPPHPNKKKKASGVDTQL